VYAVLDARFCDARFCDARLCDARLCDARLCDARCASVYKACCVIAIIESVRQRKHQNMSDSTGGRTENNTGETTEEPKKAKYAIQTPGPGPGPGLEAQFYNFAVDEGTLLIPIIGILVAVCGFSSPEEADQRLRSLLYRNVVLKAMVVVIKVNGVGYPCSCAPVEAMVEIMFTCQPLKKLSNTIFRSACVGIIMDTITKAKIEAKIAKNQAEQAEQAHRKKKQKLFT
jgi:hypothetical protein